MNRTTCTCAATAFAMVAVACNANESTAPQGTLTVERLEFAWAEVSATEPLLLVAELRAPERAVPERVLLQATSGDARTTELDPFAGCAVAPVAARSPWAGCSDEALTTLIRASAGRVFVGFKEASAERGVDEQGAVLTSDSTTERMKQWLRNEGVTITSEYELPAVAALMEPDGDLVTRMRGHASVDYVEPIFPGRRTSGPSSVSVALLLTAGSEGLVAVIPTDGSWLRIEPGDSVIATYRQPDGSTIVARARVRG